MLQQQQQQQQQQDEEEFNMQAEMFLGDIMWGRCGKQPYWPCLVVRDEEGRFYKTKLCSNDVWRIWFYVQWLGDGRHSWVGLSYLVPFERAPNPQQTPYDMLKNYILTCAPTMFGEFGSMCSGWGMGGIPGVGPQGAMPDQNTVLRWVAAFRSTSSLMIKKPPGLPCSVHTPENIDRVSVVKS
ncbi:uncharacterized protein LOC111053125 [Nilaparvata lugens]|uniref:uncharacterized protein LOC111053125 n=1 Tax=Nilaparvata lugens TaxID=108931 RepID=UPI00193E6B3D|nr:uncharacterized protein LOC111053125 [Nilaparvata lugens]